MILEMSDMLNRQTQPAKDDYRLLILSKRLEWSIESLSATSRISLTTSSMRFDQGGRCRNNRVRHQFQATVECQYGFWQTIRVLNCRSKHSHGGRNSNSCSRSCIEIISCEIEDGKENLESGPLLTDMNNQ